ncbi:hypothetical protein CKA32_004958 [Geitlerinema sp. FC II]|nr:hypothetical protein CKA32_004958 [Geitlerinema sp. FC II]
MGERANVVSQVFRSMRTLSARCEIEVLARWWQNVLKSYGNF